MIWPKYADYADNVEYTEYADYVEYVEYVECAECAEYAIYARFANQPCQIKLSLPSILYQAYQTKITGQSSQHLGP